MDLKCTKCGATPLLPDEIAATKKFLGRNVYAYLCLHCLAKTLDTTEEELRIRIADFKAQGCTLFR